MTRPMVSVRDPETLKRVLREMNDEEFAQWKIDKAQAIEDKAQQKIDEQERRARANKLVSKLGESVDLTKGEIAELLRLTI